MVDHIDRQIVDAMLADPRAGVREVASETGIAATTVSRRLDALIESDCIESFRPRVEYAAFGYTVTAVFRLSVDWSGVDRVADRLAESPNIVTIYEVTGTEDIVAVGKFRDTAAMNERIKRLLTDDDVRTVATNVVLDVGTEFDQFPVANDGEEEGDGDPVAD